MENRVTLSDIFRHIGDPRTQVFTEGEQIYHAQHIMHCGILYENETEIKVIALYSQFDCNPKSPQQRINVVLHKKNDYSLGIKEIDCTCEDGATGVCKHSIAVLLCCNNTYVSDFEETSEAKFKYLWKGLENYKVGPICEMFRSKGKKSKRPAVAPLTDEEANKFKEKVAAMCPDSAFAMYYKSEKEIT